MVWIVGSTAALPDSWVVGSTSGASSQLAGSVTDFLEAASAAATFTSPPLTLRQLHTPYQAGATCELEVVGADGVFQVLWSPTNNPLDAAAVELTVTSTNLSLGAGRVFATAQRTVVRYGEIGWLFITQSPEVSGLQTTLLAETGKQYVTLVAPLVAPELGVWAIPDLAAGDQLICWNAQPAGVVEVFPDRSFVADGTVLTFDAEAHLAGEGYTNTETQDIDFGLAAIVTGVVTDYPDIVVGTMTNQSIVSIIAGSATDFPQTATGTISLAGISEWVSPMPIANCAGMPLTNQVNIEYVFLPGHTVHAPEAIVVRSNGTTDAQGYFRAQDIVHPAGSPVTLIARWIEGTRDRYVVLYTQLTVQG